ncbi:hypothetical protein RJ55_04084 [Drechmeria coniospora]|nr:hypothetical protein RJ55_04084 [Drechmeria coniospora]
MTPLLPRGSGRDGNTDPERDPPTAPPRPTGHAMTRLQHATVCTFAAVHILRGVGLIAYPGVKALLSSASIDPSLHLFCAFVGLRDVLLGGVLAMSLRRREGEAHGALAAMLLSDAVDTFVLIFAEAATTGAWRGPRPVVVIAAVAALATVEHMTLWSMAGDGPAVPGGDSRAHQLRILGGEDKMARLDSWMLEMQRAETAKGGYRRQPADADAD